MFGLTLRPKNQCKECGYKWYPRGKTLSYKCPRCGGTETEIHTSTASVLGGCGCLVLFACLGFGLIASFVGKSALSEAETLTRARERLIGKSPKETIDRWGEPSEVQPQDDETPERWVYANRFRDPETKKLIARAVVVFSRADPKVIERVEAAE